MTALHCFNLACDEGSYLDLSLATPVTLLAALLGTRQLLIAAAGFCYRCRGTQMAQPVQLKPHAGFARVMVPVCPELSSDTPLTKVTDDCYRSILTEPNQINQV